MRKETYLRLSGNADLIDETPHPWSKEGLDDFLEKIMNDPSKGPAWMIAYEYGVASRKRRQNLIQYIFDIDPV